VYDSDNLYIYGKVGDDRLDAELANKSVIQKSSHERSHEHPDKASCDWHGWFRCFVVQCLDKDDNLEVNDRSHSMPLMFKQLENYKEG